MADPRGEDLIQLRTEFIKAKGEILRLEQLAQTYKAEAKRLKIKNAILEDRLKRKKDKTDSLKAAMKRMRPAESLDDY